VVEIELGHPAFWGVLRVVDVDVESDLESAENKKTERINRDTCQHRQSCVSFPTTIVSRLRFVFLAFSSRRGRKLSHHMT